jgi:hypothetical protein
VWRFGESSGDTCAAAKGGLDLTLSGTEGTDYSRGVSWGTQQRGVYFSGAAIAAVGTAGADIIAASATPSYSLEVTCATYDTTVTQGIMCATTGSGDEEQYIAFALGVDGSCRIGGAQTDAAKAVGYLGLMHLLLVRAPTTITLYLNGAKVASASESRAIGAGYDTMRIGDIARGYPMRGVVFEARLSDIARDAAYAQAAAAAALRI